MFRALFHSDWATERQTKDIKCRIWTILLWWKQPTLCLAVCVWIDMNSLLCFALFCSAQSNENDSIDFPKDFFSTFRSAPHFIASHHYFRYGIQYIAIWNRPCEYVFFATAEAPDWSLLNIFCDWKQLERGCKKAKASVDKFDMLWQR